MGTIALAVPRVRGGSYLPRLVDPRRRTERALLTMVQEAYESGVSTRRVDDLVRALGIEGISKSEVSRICAALDAEVERFRCRPLGDLKFPYLWLDATVRHEAPPLLASARVCPHRRPCRDDVLVEDREGDVGEQR